METDRRWSARIEFLTETGRRIEVVDATASDYDLQRDQLRSALREAMEYIAAGLAVDAHVELFKTTKAHGTRRDRTWYLDGRTGRAY